MAQSRDLLQYIDRNQIIVLSQLYRIQLKLNIQEDIFKITENQSNHFLQNSMQVYCTAVGAKDINYQKLQKQLNGQKILNSQISTKQIKLSSISTLLQQVDEYQRLFSQTQQFIFKIEKILGDSDKKQYQMVDNKKLQDFFITLAQQEISEDAVLEILQNKMNEATQQFNKQNNNLIQVQQQILTYEKQNTGQFTTRSANQLLGAQKINSDTLANMVVILQKHNYKEFKALIDDVNDENNPFVPQSYAILTEDAQQAAVAILYLKSQKSTAVQLMRDNKFTIKEFDDNYVEENQTYHDSLKKQKEQKIQDLCHFIQSVKGELYKILYEIIIMKTICECQLRFGQQFKLAVIVATDNQMKSVKSTIKDQMADQQLEDDAQLYDKDFEQDNAFLSIVMNNYQIGDVLK